MPKSSWSFANARRDGRHCQNQRYLVMCILAQLIVLVLPLVAAAICGLVLLAGPVANVAGARDSSS
jgi:hypothetical protein